MKKLFLALCLLIGCHRHVPIPVGVTGLPNSIIPLYYPALATSFPVIDRDTRVVDGYAHAGDGGGGIFIWDSVLTAANDSCTIFHPTGYSTGAWHRAYSGGIDVRYCGADPTGTIAADTAIGYANAVASAGNGVVLFPQGTYKLTTSIGPPAGIRWQGQSRKNTILQQSTARIDAVLCLDDDNSAISDMSIVADGGNGVHIKGVANFNLERPCALERVNISGIGTAARAYTVTAANPAVVTLAAHGFSAGTRIQFNAPILGGYFAPVFNSVGNTVTAAAHGLANGDQVQFNDIFDGGLLPSPLVSRTSYYVISATTNTFQLSLTSGGSAIAFTGTGSANSELILWGMSPGGPTGGAAALGFDPRLEYWVSPTGLTTNTFEVSSIPPVQAGYPTNVGLSGVPLGTISKNLVGAVAAGVYWDSEGANVYDGSAYDVAVFGAGGTVSATHAFVTDANTSGAGPSYVPVHTMVINGQAQTCRRTFSNRAGELRAVGTHTTDQIDGSGGGLLAYSNASNGLDVRQLRLEQEAIESAVYADTFAFAAYVDGSLGFTSHAVTAIGSLAFNLSTGAFPNVGGTQTYGIFSQDVIHPYKTTTTEFTNNTKTDGNFEADGTGLIKGKVIIGNAFGQIQGAGTGLAFYDPNATLAGSIVAGNLEWNLPVSEYSPAGTSIGSLRMAAGISTTAAGATLILPYAMASDQVAIFNMSLGAKRTGGSRGTGAVDDSAYWQRTAKIAMIGANSGTPTVLQASSTVGTDYSASDLTSAGITFAAFSVASGGLVNFTVTGATSTNINWSLRLELLSVN